MLGLSHVGVLSESENAVASAAFVGSFGGNAVYMSCFAAAAAFPPAAPALMPAVLTSSRVIFTSHAAMVGSKVYDEVTYKPTRVLGDPIFLSEE